MKPKYGYCAVTADFLHIGHIRFIKACADQCQKLIVGIMTDECVVKYKGRKPIMNQLERKEIVESIKYVHVCHYQDEFEFNHTIDRMKLFHKEEFVIFCNDEHNRKGADVIIPKIKGISSTLFKEIINANIDNCQLSI